MRIVISHSNADLDALASMIAAAHLYEGAVAVAPSGVSPLVHRFLALHKDHYPIRSLEQIEPDEVEEVIVVDVRDGRRLREFREVLEKAPRVVAFDHHPSTEHDIRTDEEWVEPLGACVTLLLERLVEQDIAIEADEATLYLLGIYADTGRLSYSSTSPRDVKMAAMLLERGAQLRVMNRYMRDVFSPEQSELLVRLISDQEEVSVDQVEVAFVSARMEDSVRGASSAVQEVMELAGHDAVFGFMQFSSREQVLVIGRSRVSYVDVGEVMRRLGGGGHTGAGSATLKDADLDEARRKVRALLEEMDLKPTRVSEIMSESVHFLDHETSLEEAEASLEGWGVTGAPVRRDGELVGIISRRDIERARRGERLHLPVSSHMAHQVQTIDQNEPIEDTLDLMTREDIGRLPVTNSEGIAGIVTRTDLIRRLYMKQRDDSDL